MGETKSDFLFSAIAIVSWNILSRWTKLVSVFGRILSDSDLHIPGGFHCDSVTRLFCNSATYKTMVLVLHASLISCRVGFVLFVLSWLLVAFTRATLDVLNRGENGIKAILCSWALTLYKYLRRGSKILDLNTCHTSQNFTLEVHPFKRIKNINFSLKPQLQSLHWLFGFIELSSFPSFARCLRSILTKNLCFRSTHVRESSLPLQWGQTFYWLIYESW